MSFSGGFNGRTNKLVDSCYNWWVGAMAKSLSDYLNINSFWNDEGLFNYVIQCCQNSLGGICDRPPENPDFFHTMYSLIGLSVTSRKFIFEKTGLLLNEIDSRYAIPKKSVLNSIKYFSQ